MNPIRITVASYAVLAAALAGCQAAAPPAAVRTARIDRGRPGGAGLRVRRDLA